MSFKIARILSKNYYKKPFKLLQENRSFATKSEDDDCVCDQYVYEPEYTIQKTPVIEKKCEPCSFWDWKPKEPELFDASKQQLKRKEEAKKKRTLKDCYPEMVIDDGCPAKKKKKTPPKWSEVFPNNVCLCECKTKKQEEEELAAAKLEQQIKSKRKKRERPHIPCPGPDWDHSGRME